MFRKSTEKKNTAVLLTIYNFNTLHLFKKKIRKPSKKPIKVK